MDYVESKQQHKEKTGCYHNDIHTDKRNQNTIIHQLQTKFSRFVGFNFFLNKNYCCQTHN